MTVLIVPDGPSYFAQGVDEDYAAQGATVEEAKAHFLRGLELTKDLQIRHFGETRIGPAPEEVLSDLRNDPALIVWTV